MTRFGAVFNRAAYQDFVLQTARRMAIVAGMSQDQLDGLDQPVETLARWAHRERMVLKSARESGRKDRPRWAYALQDEIAHGDDHARDGAALLLSQIDDAQVRLDKVPFTILTRKHQRAARRLLREAHDGLTIVTEGRFRDGVTTVETLKQMSRAADSISRCRAELVQGRVQYWRGPELGRRQVDLKLKEAHRQAMKGADGIWSRAIATPIKTDRWTRLTEFRRGAVLAYEAATRLSDVAQRKIADDQMLRSVGTDFDESVVARIEHSRAGDKVQNDKVQNDKVQNDKVQNDKDQNDKDQNIVEPQGKSGPGFWETVFGLEPQPATEPPLSEPPLSEPQPATARQPQPASKRAPSLVG